MKNRITNLDIEKHKPVWSAVSDLWLDKELQNFELDFIALTMFESGYSIKKLTKIYNMEVAPIVYANLYNVAGEWADFNENWLYETIINSLEKRSRFATFFLKIKRPFLLNMTRDDVTIVWLRTKSLY